MTSKRSIQPNSHMVSELFTFLLFAMFLLLSLLIVVIGADGYRGVVSNGELTGEIRTSLGYVSGKVRSDAAADGVEIVEIDGRDVLVLMEYYEEVPYETAIFYKDGALWESYRDAKETEFSFDFGDRLVEVSGFSFAWTQDALLQLTATDANGFSHTLHLAQRTGLEGVAR